MKTWSRFSRDTRAVILFVAMTFSLTIAALLAVRIFDPPPFNGLPVFDQLAVALAMFFPGLSAIVIQKFYLHKKIGDLGFRPGPAADYAKTYFMITGVFVLNYLVTFIFFQKPDMTLESFIDSTMPGTRLPYASNVMIAIFSAITFLIAPLANMIPSLGEEVGWRGFLLAILEKKGKLKAALVSSAIWALWHTPIILITGFQYGERAFPGMLIHFCIVTSLGLLISFFWFKTRSTILAAFMHSAFNANVYGVWTMIFVSPDRTVVGPVGIINCAILALLGAYMAMRLGKDGTGAPASV